jgi:hypothetical protein
MLELSGSSPEIRLTDTDLTSTYSVLSGNGGHVSIQADASNQTSGSRITMEVDGVEQLRIASTGRVTVKKSSNSEVDTLSSSLGSVAIDLDDSNNFSLTMTEFATTLANPTSTPVVGQSGCIVITQDSLGSSYTLDYGTQWHFESGTHPTLSTGANDVDTLAYYVASTTSIQAVLLKDMS